jgi:hypothetical protein
MAVRLHREAAAVVFLGSPGSSTLLQPLEFWEVADSAVVRKWEWLFVNTRGCKTPDYYHDRILNSCQGGINASVCSGFALKSNDGAADVTL